jgi:hypothetical protein
MTSGALDKYAPETSARGMRVTRWDLLDDHLQWTGTYLDGYVARLSDRQERLGDWPVPDRADAPWRLGSGVGDLASCRDADFLDIEVILDDAARVPRSVAADAEQGERAAATGLTDWPGLDPAETQLWACLTDDEAAAVRAQLLHADRDKVFHDPTYRRPTTVASDAAPTLTGATDLRVVTIADYGQDYELKFDDARRLTVYCASRRLRLLEGPRLRLWLWDLRTDVLWDAQRLAGSYQAFPAVREALTDTSDPDALAGARLRDVAQHMWFCLEHLEAHLSQWQAMLMYQLSTAHDREKSSSLKEIQRSLGEIGAAATLMDLAIRADTLRLAEDFAADTPRNRAWAEQLTRLRARVGNLRSPLGDAASQFTAVAQGELLTLSEDNRTRTEHFQRLASLVAALVLIPGLVIGVYGSNLSELTPDSRGNLHDLVLLVLVAIVLSVFLLPPVRLRGGWAWAAGLAGSAVAAALLGTLSHVPPLVFGIGVVAPLALSLLHSHYGPRTGRTSS